MNKRFQYLRSSIVSRLAITMGLVLFTGITIQMFFYFKFQEQKITASMQSAADLVGNTIRLGTHYAMMLNAREDINQIIQKVGQQEEIVSLRIYSKSGEIKYSKDTGEIDRRAEVSEEVCSICHATDPPQATVSLEKRTRIFTDATGLRQMGITGPIYNEPSCATDACHVHPPEKKVLGILDVVLSLETIDRELALTRAVTTALSGLIFLLSIIIIYLVISTLVRKPIRKLVSGTERISRGDYNVPIEIDRDNEMGALASAINKMGREIAVKEKELNRQRDEYQTLFEVVPCYVTVQDREYRLTAFNRKFAENFDPEIGDYCYRAYKGRDCKCENCPVELTFLDGQSHISEESGVDKDGTPKHWIVSTTPIRDENGEVMAAMEMSLDITPRKQLEAKLHITERQYQAIFNNIPNPVFILDRRTLNILDCNDCVQDLYGYEPEELWGRSFLELFSESEHDDLPERIRNARKLDQIRHSTKDGATLYVNIRLSPSEYPGEDVLLATASDITSRVEAELQLVQAGKMATLGEMATGVAHELNQPLSVIKTASSYFIRKVGRNEPIDAEVLKTMSEEIDSHVNRASKIINHMREFGRKSTLSPEMVQVNEVIHRAFDIFSQQLKLRDIQVEWHLDESLPTIKADPGRLEQVFINLLINARDAIEERGEKEPLTREDRIITLSSHLENNLIVAEITDTGIGIPPALAEKIFEPFFTTKVVGKGTGLGLSISYGIIRERGGTIEAVPSTPHGTRIIIKLPITEKSDEDTSSG